LKLSEVRGPEYFGLLHGINFTSLPDWGLKEP
jgi:hypothetical protein